MAYCSHCGAFMYSQNQPLFAETLCYDCEMEIHDFSDKEEEDLLKWHWDLMMNC